MARRTKADAEATRQRLLDAAETLFSEKGVTNTSLADVAAAAGVTRGAIYWHFKNKVDLFEAMHARVRLSVGELENQALTGSDPIAGLQDYWITSLRQISHDSRRRRVIEILFRKCEYVDEYQAVAIRINEWTNEIVEAMTMVYTKAAERNQLAPGLTPHQAARATFCMIVGILFNWMAAPGLCIETEDLDTTVALFFKTMRA